MKKQDFDIVCNELFENIERSLADSFNISLKDARVILDSNDIYNSFFAALSEFIDE